MSNEEKGDLTLLVPGHRLNGNTAKCEQVDLVDCVGQLCLSANGSANGKTKPDKEGYECGKEHGASSSTVGGFATSTPNCSDMPDEIQPNTPLSNCWNASLASDAASETAVSEETKSQVSQRLRRSRTGGTRSITTNSDGVRNGTSTKVYYRIDDESTPYCTEVPVAPDRITLGDFKMISNRFNFTFYYKTIDSEMGGEVKVEIREDNHPLCKSSNGQFELFLLTGDGSSHSSHSNSTAFSKSRPTIPGPAPPLYQTKPTYYYNNSRMLPSHLLFDRGHRHRLGQIPFEDSTIYTESDARVFSDDESRVSTSTDNITSVSRQHYNPIYRRRNRRQCHRRQPSRASSLSSMTETSMHLNVVTVTLNMEPVSLLGINVIGQSSSRGDNGIYVASIIPGSAAALDGRIEPGDMILEVNNVSFENLSNDQAVEVLKNAVGKPGPLKLTVAKCFDGGARSNYFAVPAREPVRPIDTLAWVQHTNAVRTMTNGGVFMNAIPEESAPTPVPGQQSNQQQPHPLHGAQQLIYAGGTTFHPSYNQPQNMMNAGFVRPPSRNGSNGAGAVAHSVASGGMFPQNAMMMANGRMIPSTITATTTGTGRLDVNVDKRLVVQAMVQPNSGLDIRDRTWLKIPIPMSFLGSDLVDWLIARVEGLRNRKDANKYATDLLKSRFIAHVVDKSSFSEQCYYVVGDECAELIRIEQVPSSLSQFNYQQQQYYLQQQQFQPQQGWMGNVGHLQAPQCNVAHSTANEYASLPPIASPFPPPDGGGIWPPSTSGMNAVAHSQTNSNHSNDGGVGGGGNSSGGGSSATTDHRRKAILPPAPSTSAQPKMTIAGGSGSGQPPGGNVFFRHYQNQTSLGQNQFATNGISGAGNYASGDFIFQHL